MRGEPRVIEYLNKGVRSELTAINQYWVHYRLLDNWGYKTLAKKWREESMEEMQHADKLIVRIIFFDGMPNLQVLDPLHIGQNVKEVLDCDLQSELTARALYEEAATYCHSVKDYVSRDPAWPKRTAPSTTAATRRWATTSSRRATPPTPRSISRPPTR